MHTYIYIYIYIYKATQQKPAFRPSRRAPLGKTGRLHLDAAAVQARIEKPWREMDQFRFLDWSEVRHRLQTLHDGLEHVCSASCMSEHGCGMQHPILCGEVEVRSTKNGALRLASRQDASAFCLACLVGGDLDVVIIGQDDQRHASARDGARSSGHLDAKEWGSVVQPVVLYTDGSWLVGEVDPKEVQLVNHSRAPKWPTVLRYCLMLEDQVASGSLARAPPVKISRHRLHGGWIAVDGAHRLYVAFLSGSPLRCQWKPNQQDSAGASPSECAEDGCRKARGLSEV